jgi:hypothetical protein
VARGVVIVNAVGVVSFHQLMLFLAGVGFITWECSVVGGRDRHVHFIVLGGLWW